MTERRNFRALFFVVFIAAFLVRPAVVPGTGEGAIFSTWEGFEADKCASIWLIKRFINPQAMIKFFPKGQTIEEGTPFDTPDAKFKRTHDMSTFEWLVKYFRIEDPKVVHLGNIIHDIEINTWERKRFELSSRVQQTINDIIEQTKDNSEVIAKGCAYFDFLYDGLSLDK
jgi:hypothetical protein